MSSRVACAISLHHIAAILVCVSGCTRPTIQGGPIDYALDIKRLTLAVELVSKTSPSETPGQVEVLLENLRDAPNEDAGQYGAEIEEITRLAKELESLYKASAPLETTKEKVKELAIAARQIPGKVLVREKEME